MTQKKFHRPNEALINFIYENDATVQVRLASLLFNFILDHFQGM